MLFSRMRTDCTLFHQFAAKKASYGSMIRRLQRLFSTLNGRVGEPLNILSQKFTILHKFA
ncbi:hypothetical protein NG42_11115 [Winslowiella iniecta]|uniref:Uncharacterized protein n=1 Tax=Winslowiella iniecta TaxID=1560201 RepID=A0A0L7T301_9GAMM|nr:hypothetical protein NG42_11115 [Winslowiella iniecta]KOC93487.1 hypothetical protein NG43_09490 [Winslowiella iniecta]